jgi:hypothetical protein
MPRPVADILNDTEAEYKNNEAPLQNAMSDSTVDDPVWNALWTNISKQATSRYLERRRLSVSAAMTAAHEKKVAAELRAREQAAAKLDLNAAMELSEENPSRLHALFNLLYEEKKREEHQGKKPKPTANGNTNRKQQAPPNPSLKKSGQPPNRKPAGKAKGHQTQSAKPDAAAGPLPKKQGHARGSKRKAPAVVPPGTPKSGRARKN